MIELGVLIIKVIESVAGELPMLGSYANRLAIEDVDIDKPMPSEIMEFRVSTVY